MVLSACEERPYPSPTHGEAPPAPPPAALMGEPDQAAPYTPPPSPGDGYTSSTQLQSPAYSPSRAYVSGGYESGAVVAMAPIPNPGDPGSEPYYAGYRGRHHRRYDSYSSQVGDQAVTSPYGEGHPAPGRRVYVYSAPIRRPYAASTYAASASRGTYARVVHAPKAHAALSPGVKTTKLVSRLPLAAPPKLPTVVAFDGKDVGHKGAALAAEATGDRTTRLASLQSALTDAIAKGAMLTAPASFTANQPTDVTLVIPAAFSKTLRDEAQTEGLSDAAASVSMTALLSGDGFVVSPADTQSAPVRAEQATEFHWTVTAQPGAIGPLHADVGANLLGGGSDKLALGSVQKTADLGVKLKPRVIGASILVLIAALVVAWLARGRGPTPTTTARRPARDRRPLDMSSGGQGTL